MSRGRSSGMPPSTAGQWYPDEGPPPARAPRGRPYDPSRSLLLDIPSASPGGFGPRHGDRAPSSQQLLTVASPPPQPTDTSAINPKLRQAQKTGDLYNISVNLNALQLARPPSAAEFNTATSMRRTTSLQDVTASWAYRPSSATPMDDPDGGPTLVQVRRDDPEPSPSLPTTSTLSPPRPTARTPRPPSVRTLRIPASPGRRSRSVSRSRIGPDESYVIKSLRSTTDNETTGRTSSTRVASVAGDGKIGFDVELSQEQLRQQQRQSRWEMDESATTQQTLSFTSSGRRSLMIESITPSYSSGGRLEPPDSAVDEPAYTMTMNQRMTMNYEPPLPSPEPPTQAGYFDDAVRQRTYHLASSGTLRPESAATVDGRYLAPGAQSPMGTADRPKKKKRKKPRMVNSATEMSFDKSTQITPKTRRGGNDDDYDPVGRSKKPRSEKPRSEKPRSEEPRSEKPRSEKPRSEKPRSEKPRSEKPRPEEPRSEKPPAAKSPAPRKTPEPRMISRSTQMAVNKSTQVTRCEVQVYCNCN